VVARTSPVVIGLLWGLMAFAIVISQGAGNVFIYFQF
jgi:alginate O-acetyltransferase complex protein AlgI